MWWIWTVCIGLASGAPVDTLTSELERWKAHRSPDTVPDIHGSEYARALSGEIVVGTEVVEGFKAVKSYGLIAVDLPIGIVWKAVADKDHHAHHLSVSHSKTVDGTPRSSDHTIFQFLDIPILANRWWLVRIRYNETLYTASNGRAWELWWSDRNQEPELRSRLDSSLLDDGIPIAWSKGAWLLVDLGNNTTLIEYHTWSDPGGSIPVAATTRFAAGTVKTNLTSMVTFTREHIPTCPSTFMKPDGSAL